MLVLLAAAVHALVLAWVWARRARGRPKLGAGGVLDAFAPVRALCACPFAKRARLVGCGPEEAREQLKRVAQARGQLDGVVVRLDRAGDFPAFAKGVTALLEAVGGPQRFADPSWQLEVGGVAFSAAGFADVYPESSPRWAPNGAFVLLTPAHVLNDAPLVPPLGAELGVRADIRLAFAERGQAYAAPARGEPASHRVVRPAEEHGPAIRWWADLAPVEAPSMAGVLASFRAQLSSVLKGGDLDLSPLGAPAGEKPARGAFAGIAEAWRALQL